MMAGRSQFSSAPLAPLTADLALRSTASPRCTVTMWSLVAIDTGRDALAGPSHPLSLGDEGCRRRCWCSYSGCNNRMMPLNLRRRGSRHHGFVDQVQCS
ncbi:hypothetical protein PVAP13_3NG302983 [Panicum virgatum]|uniref:Uncharacterized protein n=1 Tax=Panicum virgatum TaxID=38727 RepID=A0A8T0UAK6_PANVG|nr:hypothetical protein PVAP13_3NG302983 [Panicum virgatum]